MVIIQNGSVYGFFCDRDLPINSVGYFLLESQLVGHSDSGKLIEQLNKIICTLTLK